MSRLRSILSQLFRPQPRPVPDPSPKFDGTEYAATVFSLVNSERAIAGKPPYVRDDKLDSLAQQWAIHMAGTDVLDHGKFFDRLRSVYPDRDGSENIAGDFRTPASVIDGWMKSPGHRANILGDYETIGIGIARSASGGFYWCEDFASSAHATYRGIMVLPGGIRPEKGENGNQR